MFWQKKIFDKDSWPLIAIVGLGFVIRLVGVGYGLPQTLVNDETPFTLAALKMIQLHTLIPALAPDAFHTILPYPPYLAYLLLIPFVFLLGGEYLFLHGHGAFEAHLLSDLSAFFITARVLNVIIGTIGIFLLYHIGKSLFRSRAASLGAAFLLATSLLQEALSMVGRNWEPVTLIFISIFFFLTREQWSFERRYLYAFVAAAVGIGFSSFCAFFCFFILFYYLILDSREVGMRKFFEDAKRLLPALLSFVVLAIVPILLYHGGNAFLTNVTAFDHKSMLQLLGAPIAAFTLVAWSEPVLIAFFISGLCMLLAKKKRIGLLLLFWSLFYVALFYVLFRFEARFLAPLIPIVALGGGYLIDFLWQGRIKIIVGALLLLPVVMSVRLDDLVLQNDTRAQAYNWVLENLQPQDKVLVFANGMRLPTQKAAVEELQIVEPSVMRQVDDADATLNRTDVPYVLNELSAVDQNDAFFSKLPAYAKAHGYHYLVVEPYFEMSRTTVGAFSKLTEHAQLVKTFTGFGEIISMSNSSFAGPFWQLFGNRSFGPTILIYRFDL